MHERPNVKVLSAIIEELVLRVVAGIARMLSGTPVLGIITKVKISNRYSMSIETVKLVFGR